MLAKKAPNVTDKHVGARVRMRRMMLGMSQGTLGGKLGITFQQIQKNEQGINRIGASRLQEISKILQVPVSFFFDGAPGSHQSVKGDGVDLAGGPPILTEFFSLPHANELAKAFVAIKDTAKRKALLDIAKALVS